MPITCPFCRGVLDQYRTGFAPKAIRCPGCGNKVTVPAIEIPEPAPLIGAVADPVHISMLPVVHGYLPPARQSKRTKVGLSSAMLAVLFAGLSFAAIGGVALLLYQSNPSASNSPFPLAIRNAEPEKAVIVEYLKENVNDLDGFEIIRWSKPKRGVDRETGQRWTSYVIKLRARNALGALVLDQVQLRVKNGQVVSCQDVSGMPWDYDNNEPMKQPVWQFIEDMAAGKFSKPREEPPRARHD